MPSNNIAKMYGISREKEGFSERANIINRRTQIVFLKVYETAQVPDIEEIINFLKSPEIKA